MKKKIYKQYEKKQISQLPRVTFPGRIIVVSTEKEAERAVEYLLSCSLLGLDTETKPSFKKGRQNVVSLLQVSTQDTCFLFRLNLTGLTPALVRLLEDPYVLKVGLSLGDDVLSLHKRGEFKPGNFVDLQDHMRELGVDDLSLQKLYANIFSQRISKSQQLSNWEKDILDEKQKLYAATDAWACVMLYQEYLRMKAMGDYVLIDNTPAEATETQDNTLFPQSES